MVWTRASALRLSKLRSTRHKNRGDTLQDFSNKVPQYRANQVMLDPIPGIGTAKHTPPFNYLVHREGNAPSSSDGLKPAHPDINLY